MSLRPYFEFLRARLDCSGRFLDHLVDSGVLNDEQRNKYRNLHEDYYKQNEKVLKKLCQRLDFPESQVSGIQKKSNDFEKILQALKDSRQEHLEQHIRDKKGVNDEDIDSSQACSPLSSSQINEISKLTGYLCDNGRLRCTKALRSKLLQKNCIQRVHRDRLRAIRIEDERSRTLLGLIKRGSVGSLHKTVQALVQLDQKEAAEKLRNTNSAYTALVHVTLSFSPDSSKEHQIERHKGAEKDDLGTQSSFMDTSELSSGTSLENSRYKNTQSSTAVHQSVNSEASSVYSGSIALKNVLADKRLSYGNGHRHNLPAGTNSQFDETDAASKVVNSVSHTGITVNGLAVCVNNTSHIYKCNGNCHGAGRTRSRSSCSETGENSQIPLTPPCGNGIRRSDSGVQTDYNSFDTDTSSPVETRAETRDWDLQASSSASHYRVLSSVEPTNNTVDMCEHGHENCDCTDSAIIVTSKSEPSLPSRRDRNSGQPYRSQASDDVSSSSSYATETEIPNTPPFHETGNQINTHTAQPSLQNNRTLNEFSGRLLTLSEAEKISEAEKAVCLKLNECTDILFALSKEKNISARLKDTLLFFTSNSLQFMRADVGQSIVLSFYCPDVGVLNELIKLYESNTLQDFIADFILEFIKDKKEYEGLTVTKVEIHESDLEDMKRWRVSQNKRKLVVHSGGDITKRRKTANESPPPTECGSTPLGLHEVSETYDKSQTHYSTSDKPIAGKSVTQSLLDNELSEKSSSSLSTSSSVSGDSDVETEGCRKINISRETAGSFTLLPILAEMPILQTAAYTLMSRLAALSARSVTAVYCQLAVCNQLRSEILQDTVWKNQLRARLEGNPLFGACRIVAKGETVLELPIERDGGVKGVTYLDGFYYSIVNRCHKVFKFRAQPPYEPGEPIEMPGAKFPTDIVACAKTKRLYVGDSNSECIWCIDVSNFKISKIIENVYWPLQLSITSDGRILTVDDSLRLRVISPDGIFTSVDDRPSMVVPMHLPTELDHPWHVMQKPDGNLLICCGDNDDSFHGVVELDPQMEIVARFSCSTFDPPLATEEARTTQKDLEVVSSLEAETESEFQTESALLSPAAQTLSRGKSLLRAQLRSESLPMKEMEYSDICFDSEHITQLQLEMYQLEATLTETDTEMEAFYAHMPSVWSRFRGKKEHYNIAPGAETTLHSGFAQKTKGVAMENLTNIAFYGRYMSDLNSLIDRLSRFKKNLQKAENRASLMKWFHQRLLRQEIKPTSFELNRPIPDVTLQPEGKSKLHPSPHSHMQQAIFAEAHHFAALQEISLPTTSYDDRGALRRLKARCDKLKMKLDHFKSRLINTEFSHLPPSQSSARTSHQHLVSSTASPLLPPASASAGTINAVSSTSYAGSKSPQYTPLNLPLLLTPGASTSSYTAASADIDTLLNKSPVGLKSPRYMAFGPPDSDALFVCDRDNSRVLLVSGDMKTSRVVVDQENGCPAKPFRIHYDVEHKRLLVGDQVTSEIHVFNV